mmetsp:Transcript_36568/g.97472  ORF Transcript_36568/g.97472 Transcript_36568/m.97472 type:complete len:112 (+) Transcript_36568:2615-2950(+)
MDQLRDAQDHAEEPPQAAHHWRRTQHPSNIGVLPRDENRQHDPDERGGSLQSAELDRVVAREGEDDDAGSAESHTREVHDGGQKKAQATIPTGRFGRAGRLKAETRPYRGA